MSLKGVLRGSPGYVGAQEENGGKQNRKTWNADGAFGNRSEAWLRARGMELERKSGWDGETRERTGQNGEKPENKDPEAKPEAAR